MIGDTDIEISAPENSTSARSLLAHGASDGSSYQGGSVIRELFVVTHTEAQHHVDGLVGGWFDSRLTDRGTVQAERVASELQRMIPPNVAPAVHCSDLLRTVEAAGPIADAFRTTVTKWPGLRELSFGAAEGQPDAWFRERFTAAPPENRLDHGYGIAGAETRRQFFVRVFESLDRILATDTKTHIVVTHGGVLTPLVAAWSRIPVDSLGWFTVSASPGGVTHLVEDDFFFNRSIKTLNHIGHLA